MKHNKIINMQEEWNRYDHGIIINYQKRIATH